jgi:acetyltransferase-like isoleucine patch superfamily enzyme
LSKYENCSIHPTAIVYDGVSLGAGTIVGAYAIVGEPPHDKNPGEIETLIGENSNIRSHSVIYAGNTIGDGFQTGHKANIRELNTIGSRVSIGTHSIVEHHVEIRDGVRIHSNVFIPEFSILEEGAWIGPNVVFTNVMHPLCPDAKNCLKGPRIESYAKIGANSTLTPGVIIGEMALVGAASVVVNDVEPHSVVAGNPAKKIKMINDLGCKYNIRDAPYDGSE